jgi:hypothetical protein
MFLLGLIFLVAGVLGVLLVDWLIKRPDVVAGLVLGSVIVEAVFVDSVPSLILPEETRVVSEVLSALVFAAGVARLLRLRRFDRYHRWLMLLAGSTHCQTTTRAEGDLGSAGPLGIYSYC